MRQRSFVPQGSCKGNGGILAARWFAGPTLPSTVWGTPWEVCLSTLRGGRAARHPHLITSDEHVITHHYAVTERRDVT
ncbi:hypothetical protein E2C01_057854 [Portunus trituberculatus]|uniref:Uncharacterized protein n=1 Tax=Portunus trituberculatus TaxID=210409 RepID=A0A5B7GY43_PORTR|nr:hypothetical protein [Portunus trituberculatus]